MPGFGYGHGFRKAIPASSHTLQRDVAIMATSGPEYITQQSAGLQRMTPFGTVLS